VNLFGVNIVGLSLSVHEFDFELDSAFFKQYGSEMITEGKLKATVSLNKHETFIEASFQVKGSVVLTCDRSLDEFDFPISINEKLMYKYGDEDKEISEEVMMIHRDTATLDLGQPMFEYIVLAIPIKKLHPRFLEEDEEEEGEGKLIYSSSTKDEKSDEGMVDPRWEALKKLKK
jgi:uncharacterized metal-binding protein YceD (DUF177 family)